MERVLCLSFAGNLEDGLIMLSFNSHKNSHKKSLAKKKKKVTDPKSKDKRRLGNWMKLVYAMDVVGTPA